MDQAFTRILITSDAPPNFLRNPNVGLKTKQWKKRKVGPRFLTHNTSRVGGYVGAPGWD